MVIGLGRSIGAIRPVVALVAGMLEMPTRRFIPVNVISGLLWAPVYVLPGMVFAATLGIAAEVATRLALLLGTLLMLLFLVVTVPIAGLGVRLGAAMMNIEVHKRFSLLRTAGVLAAVLLDTVKLQIRQKLA